MITIISGDRESVRAQTYALVAGLTHSAKHHKTKVALIAKGTTATATNELMECCADLDLVFIRPVMDWQLLGFSSIKTLVLLDTDLTYIEAAAVLDTVKAREIHLILANSTIETEMPLNAPLPELSV